jgi:hypothetical protein
MGYFGFHNSRALLSGVQFPIPLQRSLLNFLLRQQQTERLGNCIGQIRARGNAGRRIQSWN